MEVSESDTQSDEQIDESVRSGKILRMRLINFMCHSNLVVDFNRRVNLLIGNNGSGKSAVLTALVVGLGSNASKTNRSANMKRKNCHHDTRSILLSKTKEKYAINYFQSLSKLEKIKQ